MAFPTTIVDIDDEAGGVELFTNVFVSSSSKVFVDGMFDADVSSDVVNMDGVFVSSSGKIFIPGMIETDAEVEFFQQVFVKPGFIFSRFFLPMIEFEIINIPPTSGNMFEIAIREPELLPFPPIVRLFEGDVLFDFSAFESGVSLIQNDVGRDPTFETAVRISLFTDRRAFNDDELPSFSRDLRGWWGDSNIGSRLWLLSRSKNIETVQDKAKFYCLEALRWMVEDGLCKRVLVDVSRYNTYTISISVQIIATEQFLYNYRYNWKLQMLETP